MTEQLLAILVCGTSAIAAFILLLWAWRLKGAVDERAREITRLVDEARKVRDDMMACRRGIEGAASMIDRAANPPKREAPTPKRAARKGPL